MSKHVEEKCRKLCISYILSSQRGMTTSKIGAKWWHSNLICSTSKQSRAKFKLNMSKHVGEKCGKLCISYILSSQRGMTPSKIGAKWWHSYLICSTLKQSHVQNFHACRHVGEKCGKRVDGDPDGRTDGDPDGHHHTIIRPVWRRAYNKNGIRLSQMWEEWSLEVKTTWIS